LKYLEGVEYNGGSYALVELSVCINIALGNHGFGHRFTKEKPLIVCVVGDNNGDYTAYKLEQEIQSGLADLIQNSEERIRIEAIFKPE
jgi:hypothetical protein